MNIEGRHLLQSAREKIGDAFLCQLFNCNTRTLQRHTALPGFVSDESIRQNIFEKVIQILTTLMSKAGGAIIARSIVSIFCAVVGGRFEITDTTPDKPTLPEEILDDYTALAEFCEAMRRGEPEGVVRNLCRKAKNELDQTLTLYSGKPIAPGPANPK